MVIGGSNVHPANIRVRVGFTVRAAKRKRLKNKEIMLRCNYKAIMGMLRYNDGLCV